MKVGADESSIALLLILNRINLFPVFDGDADGRYLSAGQVLAQNFGERGLFLGFQVH